MNCSNKTSFVTRPSEKIEAKADAILREVAWRHKTEIDAYLTEHKRREGKEFDEENLLDILVDDV